MIEMTIFKFDYNANNILSMPCFDSYDNSRQHTCVFRRWEICISSTKISIVNKFLFHLTLFKCKDGHFLVCIPINIFHLFGSSQIMGLRYSSILGILSLIPKQSLIRLNTFFLGRCYSIILFFCLLIWFFVEGILVWVVSTQYANKYHK